MLLKALNPFTFSQGDQTTLALIAIDDEGTPVDITGATFSTQIQGPNGVGPVTFPDGQHAITDAALGEFTLSLSTTDTGNCGLGPHKEILTEITIGGAPQYYRGMNLLTVYPATPFQ